MAWRFRDDERNEKSVRALLRQPANRRCINCKSMGPQYVCLNYWTFICTICSGIHRELQHRVKSVSMSKFNAQEVTSLQNGGNESARKIYFKNWDPQRQPAPDSSNVEKLREFIKNVYVDGKYCEERQPSHAGGNDREESIKGHRADIHRSSSKSLPYDGRYDDRPASAATSQSDSRLNYRGHFDHTGQHEKSTPGQVEDDRRSWERPYRQNYSENEQRPSEHNSNESRDWEASPVKEKLGDNVPSTLVENGGSHANGDRDSEKMWSMDARGQKFGSSSSFGSFDANRPGHQSTKSDSLIDLSIESSESSSVSGVPTSSDTESSGWANFDNFSVSSHSGVSSISADSKSQKSESGQWEAQWNLPAANASPLMVSAADTWPPPQQLISGNKSQDLFAPSFSASGLTGIGQNADKQINMPPSQAHFASSGTVTQDLFALSFSASGLTSIGQNDDKQIHMPPSQARFASSGTVTQDLFAPSFSASGLAGIGQNAEKQIHMPSSQTRFASSGSVTQGQMTSFIEVKSTNPFDFPSDSLSLPSQNEFPNLDPLKAALPNFNTGPTFHSPAAGTLLPQWSQFSATVSQPPVYHPSPAGGGSQQMMNSLPSSMHYMGPPVSGNFLNRTNTSMDGFYPNEGPSSRLVSARSLPTMASDSSFFTAQKLAFQNSSGISWFPDQSPVGQTGLYGATNYSDPTFSAQRQQYSPQTHYFQQPPPPHQFPLQNQDFQGNSTNPFG